MKRTYITQMPDKAGAFLAASRAICENGGNIVRVNYNKAVDIHTLFIEVSADEGQHAEIARELTALGYLPEEPSERQVILIVLTLPDKPGAVEPVLEVINNHHVNISYISSQENGTPYQYFKMGLLEEDADEIRKLLEEVSRLCEVRILEYDAVEKLLDGTVFYIGFANEMRALLHLTQEQTNEVLIQSNRLMQALDERSESPFKTFDYIRRFAKFVVEHKGENFRAEFTTTELQGGWRVHIIQPPCGSNVTILENGGELLFVDSGFACFRDELFALLRERIPDFDKRRRNLILTHADLDHAGLLDEFDAVYLNRDCYENFMLEHRGEPCFREQNPAHAPYSVLSRIISGYRTPSLKNAVIIGEPKGDGLLDAIGSFSLMGLDFRLYEGAGGHVRGEMLIVCDRLKIAFTGDILVNVKGFTKEQYEFNLIAPYLMTSVNVDSKKARAIRALTQEMLKDYTILPGHGGGEAPAGRTPTAVGG